MTDEAVKKRELRAKMLKKRSEEDLRIRTEADEKILNAMLALPEYQNANTIFCYVSTNTETDTLALIETALAAGKCVCVPRCKSMGIMNAYAIRNLNDLHSGKYGIPEPKPDCPLISTEQIELNIVPCVCINQDGYRLGYGGGFYDRWLESSKALSVVLCRESLVTKEVPLESHDRRADILITDSGIRTFAAQAESESAAKK
jgi:5-formyltetrahydrofolate cyclo-ligase